MAERTSGSSGSGASATQEKTDTALKNERGKGGERFGGDEPLSYPEHEPLDKVTYRDPRPLDWPQKADRSVFIGAVHSVDNDDDDGSEKKGYVYAGKVREDEELELGGKQVKDAQVVGGSGQITVIADGEAINFGSLTGAVAADLRSALELNSNS
jgi:hypothetical protein